MSSLKENLNAGMMAFSSMNAFVTRLNELLSTHGWSVAEAAGYVQVDSANLSHIILGKRPISSRKIAQFFAGLAEQTVVSDRELRELAAAWMQDMANDANEASASFVAKQRMKLALKPMLDAKSWGLADES